MGYGQQPTSSPGHGGWQQPTLKADLITWANGLVTGRYCWQTELCVPCSTSENTVLAALSHRDPDAGDADATSPQLLSEPEKLSEPEFKFPSLAGAGQLLSAESS